MPVSAMNLKEFLLCLVFNFFQEYKINIYVNTILKLLKTKIFLYIIIYYFKNFVDLFKALFDKLKKTLIQSPVAYLRTLCPQKNRVNK